MDIDWVPSLQGEPIAATAVIQTDRRSTTAPGAVAVSDKGVGPVPDRYEAILGELGLEPLPARSVVASALLGTGPRGMRSGLLVRFAGLFGIGDGAARVALSRMLAAGEAVREQGRYRPAGPLLARRRRQETSRWPATTDWTGAWTGALVKADRRSQGERLALRQAMAHLKFAEYREGVWMRPDNLVGSDFGGDEAIVDAQCDRFEMRPHGDGLRLASQLWDLAGWASRASALISAMSPISTDLEAGDVEALTVGFLLSAAVFRHVLADPLLPEPLLPSPWPGHDLRMTFEAHDEAWQGALRLWAREAAVTDPDGQVTRPGRSLPTTDRKLTPSPDRPPGGSEPDFGPSALA